MSNILAQEMTRFVTNLIETTDDIVHNDAADRFIAQHPELVDAHVVTMIRKFISAEIKRRTDATVPPFGQYAFFSGLPAAVTVAEGRSKPLRSCTWDDLQVGREYREQNIAHAVEALESYDQDLMKLQPLMTNGLTVADVIELLAA